MSGIRKCFLCHRNGAADRLERHHIFGGANRKLSEKYGLVVDLCGDQCHRGGKLSAHRSGDTAQRLHQYGQRKCMDENGLTKEQFKKIFGKNYL